MGKEHLVRFYRGKSMKGTFSPGDCLLLKRIKTGDYKKGDIVVFTIFKEFGVKRELVHRIVSVSKKGIVTKGDNNKYKDSEILNPENITGLVTGIQRNGKNYTVSRGILGLFKMKISRTKLIFKRSIYSLLIFPYDLLLNNLDFSKLFNPKIKRVWFVTKNGFLVKLILKGKVVAKWYPERDTFFCRRPYSLFIKSPVISRYTFNNFVESTILKNGFSDSGLEKNPIEDS